MEEAKLIVKYSKILKQQGLFPGSSGNISIRDGDKIFITPSGISKDELKSDEISCIDLDGKTLNSIPPSSEYQMHIEIYKARDDVKAIIHSHPPFVLISMACGLRLKYYTVEFEVKQTKPQYVEYKKPGSKELALAVAKVIKKTDLVILKRHGIVAVGGNLQLARTLTEECENTFKINYFVHLFKLTKLMNR